MYTASTAFIEALNEAKVDYIFANFGSDHAGLIEAIAEAKENGRRTPRLITCPNEMVALSAAQGHAQISGQPQAVVVHVECGTQAMAGAIHNASKGRAPVLIFAGASPFTQEGEMRGSRNEFIQWIQDVHDQRGIVRGYMKYDAEIRTGKNIKQVVHRALKFANSAPKGPVYLMGAREVMEEEVEPVTINPDHWKPLSRRALTDESVERIVDDITVARNPLIVTSYLGRNPKAVQVLEQLCARIGAGVLESVPVALNFPSNNPLYQGNQWNHPWQNPSLATADCIIVIDSDVPWIPAVSRPPKGAVIHHIDVDPLKMQMPLWYIPSIGSYEADAEVALSQLLKCVQKRAFDLNQVAARVKHWSAFHNERRAKIEAAESNESTLTGEIVTAAIRSFVDDNTIVMSEGITHYHTIIDHLQLNCPGSLHASGGGSLGWHGGAAIGAKLAAPGKTIVALTGDGSYMFSVPSTVHWMAREYNTPFLTVVYNNRGWKAPKLSTLAVHPDGYASRSTDIGVAFDPPPDYAGIAKAAGNALALKVKTVDDLAPAMAEAFHAVRVEKRCAVIDAWVAHL